MSLPIPASTSDWMSLACRLHLRWDWHLSRTLKCTRTALSETLRSPCSGGCTQDQRYFSYSVTFPRITTAAVLSPPLCMHISCRECPGSNIFQNLTAWGYSHVAFCIGYTDEIVSHDSSLGIDCTVKMHVMARPLLRTQLVIAFVRDAESDLGQYDMWQMAFIHWPTIPWKRSALAYLPGLVAKVSQAWEHISVLRALDRCSHPLCSPFRY